MSPPQLTQAATCISGLSEVTGISIDAILDSLVKSELLELNESAQIEEAITELNQRQS